MDARWVQVLLFKRLEIGSLVDNAALQPLTPVSSGKHKTTGGNDKGILGVPLT